MDRKTRFAGRDAAPPAAGTVPRSSEKDGKRSMLGSFKNFRRSYISDLIIGSQVKVFSRFKGLKTATNAVNVAKDGSQIKPPLVPSLLALPCSPPRYAELDSPHLDSFDTETQKPMLPSPAIASQKRKQPEEHDDAPSRTKSKSRPMADNPEKRHIVQAWVNQQDEAVSPTAVQLVPGGDVSSDGSCPLPVPIPDEKDDSTNTTPSSRFSTTIPSTNTTPSSRFSTTIPDGKGDSTNTTPSSRFSTTVPGKKWLNRELELLDSLLHHRSSAQRQPQPQAITSSSEPLTNDERRGSTATTTNLTYRDSTFSTCPSVATGLTSPSEISLVLTTGRRIKTESRSSSFFSRASPRSSIASSAPSPQFFLYRTPSSNSTGLFEDTSRHELAKYPLPNVPKIDPLRSHPTFLGMDLGNVHNAVIIDQVVKMGVIAQERRVGQRSHVDATMLPYDKAPLLGAASASAPTDLAPITETASDDGASSGRKMQLHGPESTQAENCIASDNDEKGTPGSGVVCRSTPGTPESTDRLAETVVTGDRSSRNLTPATSVAEVSDLSMNDALSPQSEESDDSLSDITDYTEESLFEAVEAFGPGLSNPLLLSIILTFKDEVLRLVLARITSILGDGHGITQHNGGESPGPSSAASSSNGSHRNQNPPNQRNGSRKRALDGDSDGSREDEDDDRGKRTKPTLALPSDLEMRYRRLACPFFKRYPGTKWKGACCGPGFTTVHRIKEHVYRKHAPPYCQRCHITFADEKGLEEHLQAETPCTVRKGRLSHQGITPEQRTRLKSRKKVNRDANQTEEDRWIELYSLLFPEVPKEQIPSPYYDLKSYEELLTPTIAAAFRQLLDEDLPNRIARQLEERLRLVPGAQSNFVQAQLPDIIRNCIQEALDSVPPQLLARDEPTPSPETQVDPPASLANAPDSHNTAQIGSQFASMEPAQEIYRTHGESMPEVTLPDNVHAWVPSQDHLGAIFSETYFPNPLAESPDGLMGTNNRQSFPVATAFTTIGFPSAMLAGTPVISPTLPEMSFDGLDFTDSGYDTFRGTLASMHNTSFLFTQDEKSSPNGNAAGHQYDQYTY
ncbi:hypothetical protein CONLIGDRAFT_111396 [Coniochaeta ligniaria NRRL 30616]|uniref:C2H2-type domain-containing protein n=1 Tax=Coniochaeta ligniaria NRRL 30616 TaxID=1408157 RepID=A0A1J7I869_9PEZI|nr:hypothetical protein CONLIGDRAFT_111396 [Coniochaeta ligniaria NRRL 30616]